MCKFNILIVLTNDSALAASIIGTAIMKVKSEADLRSNFIKTPVEIVDPDLLKPGHIATA